MNLSFYKRATCPAAAILAFAIATLSSDRHTLYIAVVNRAEQTNIDTGISTSGWTISKSAANAYELNGSSKVASNPFGSSAVVNIRNKGVAFDSGKPHYVFPAHSITILEVVGQ